MLSLLESVSIVNLVFRCMSNFAASVEIICSAIKLGKVTLGVFCVGAGEIKVSLFKSL